MLKKCYGLFLGLVVLASSACVTPTHASSASIIIVSIRAGTLNSAAEERVVLYNNSSFEADITNWCLTNKTVTKFACFNSSQENEKIYLPAYSYAMAVSAFAADNYQIEYSIVYEPANASSGSIVASADTISLLDANNSLIDQHAWSSTIQPTQFWLRTKLLLLPDLFVDTDSSIDWQRALLGEVLLNQVAYREVSPDTPPDEPIDEEGNNNSHLPIIVTELLPNAIGSDEGNEFIELFNPNSEGEMSLAEYKLAVGPSLEKVLTLPSITLKAGEYKTFTNAELGYSLLNSSSRVVLLLLNETVVSEVSAYNSPKEGEAWALIDGIWQYTNQPSPGFMNITSSLLANAEGNNTRADSSGASSTLKPCAANQERSLETNRCRLISSTASAGLTECKEGQVRNAETNRCRSIASSTTNPAPCKEGQERNLETNRCRNVKQLTTADFGVKGAKAEQQGGMGWYMWAAIGGIVLLIIGYAVWEWREELRKLALIIRAKFAGKAN